MFYGVPKKILKQVFEPSFVRMDNSVRLENESSTSRFDVFPAGRSDRSQLDRFGVDHGFAVSRQR